MDTSISRFFSIFLFFCLPISFVIASHNNCINAKVICSITDKPSESQLCNSACSSGDSALANSSNSCFPGALKRWAFYMFNVKQSGTFSMTIIPKSGFSGISDYNWAIFDASEGCGNIGSALRCSATNTGGDSTGLDFSSSDLSEGSTGDGWCRYLDVVCGRTYLIVLDVPDNNSSGFEMHFGGDCQLGAPEDAFLINPSSVCQGQGTNFSVDTNSCFAGSAFINYFWDFGPGAIPPTDTGITPGTVVFSNGGTENVSLSAEFTTGGGNCTNTYFESITVSSSPPVSAFSVEGPVCTGNPVTITYTGNSAPDADYFWDFSGASVVSGSGQGPYFVQWASPGFKPVSLQVGACSTSSDVTTIFIDVAQTPTASFMAESPVCAGENSEIFYTGNGSATDTFYWNFYGGSLASGSGPGPLEVNWSLAGTQSVSLQVLSQQGCSSLEYTLSIIVNSNPVSNAGLDISMCSGNSVILGTVATLGNTYKWTPPNGLDDITLANPTLTISLPDTATTVLNYMVTTFKGNCSSTDTVQVTVFAVPSASFEAVSPVCVKESLVVNYTGNADTSFAVFIWNFDNASILDKSGETYTIYWDSSGAKIISLSVIQNGCTSSVMQYYITVTPPDAEAGPDQTICSGDGITLGVPPDSNFSYSWFPASGLSSATISNPIFSLTNFTGTQITSEYVVTTNYQGCTVTDTVVVYINPGPFADAGPDVNTLCSGSPALIGTVSNPLYSYSWAPSTGLSDTSVSSPTVTLNSTSFTPLVQNYIVSTSIPPYNCASTDTVSVTVFQIPTCTFTAPDSACANEEITLTYTGNATVNASYQWNFGGGTAFPGAGQGPHEVTWYSQGTYTVSLNVTEICSSAAPYSLTVYTKPAPLAEAGPDTFFCSGSSVLIGSGPLPGYTYSWTPATGLSYASVSKPSVTNTNNSQIPLITDYIISATAENCTSLDTVKVVVYQVPTADFLLPAQVCNPEAANIIYLGNASAGADYSWDFNGGVITSGSGQGPLMVSWPLSGKKYISLTVTENGCSSFTESDSIYAFASPVAVAGINSSVCVGNSFVLGTSPTPGYSYSWSPGYGLNDSTLANPTVYVPSLNSIIDTIQYIVTTSANNCVSSDTTLIMIFPVPQATFSVSDNGQCFSGNSFSFQSTGTFLPDAAILWNFGIANPSSSTEPSQDSVVFPTSGNFPVTMMIAQHGCYNAITQSVNVYPQPIATPATSDSVGCEPFSVNFFSESNIPVSYLWNFGDFLSSNEKSPEHIFQQDGLYYVTLTVSTSNGCSAVYEIDSIRVLPKPEAWFRFFPDQVDNLKPEVSFLDESTINILSWNWNFGDGTTSADKNPVHLFPDSGNYVVSLSVTNDYLCIDTAVTTITIFPNYTFFVPNAFTPNNDGRNDFFMPEAIGIDITDYEMYIFNRLGQLVFLTQSQDKAWDGTYDDKLVETGVYAWVINVRDVFKVAHNYYGFVTVLR